MDVARMDVAREDGREEAPRVGGEGRVAGRACCREGVCLLGRACADWEGGRGGV